MIGTLAKSPLQVYLRQDQVDSLRVLAERQEVPLSELVRQGVDRLLLEIPVHDDPLWDVVNLGHSGLGDLAAAHDRYLTEPEAQQ